jgi:phosphatidylserine/phosphatidylglycerophosphate/cardiolipin synthase-like enzyme
MAAFLLLVGLATSLSAVGRTTVQPVIDRPGACRYCDVAAAAFREAVESIDLLLADAQMEDNPLWGEVLAASARGVHVRVLLDRSDWSSSITAKNRPTVEFLLGQGIDARFDDPAVTTHAKLVIVDRSAVLIGSTNWNRYAFTDQEQANVLICDERVGQAFATWFDGLWSGEVLETRLPDGLASAANDAPAIVPLPDANGSNLYADCLVDLVDRASESVHIALYRLSVYSGYANSSSNRMVDALIRAARRGLDVRVVLDDCKFYADSAAANLNSALFLYEQGVPVRFDGPEETTHTKLVLIDGEVTVVGSTNWNYYALEQNVEASVALLGMPDVATFFDEYFETLWESGRSIGP